MQMKSGVSEVNSTGAAPLQYRRKRRMRVLIVALLVAGGNTGAMAADSAATTDKGSALTAGRHRFEHNCAICHGIDARGNGPFADLLNVKPPDLTLLARAAAGDFPFSRVYRRIDGRDLPLAHGTSGMPIWGTRLQRDGGDETDVRGRLLEIMLYLESLQQP